MQLKGRCDPAKVAELDEPEFQALYRAVDLIISHQPLPDRLESLCFRLMRRIGAKVMSHGCMKIAAHQLHYNRRLIDNLRAHDA